ncbi:hypothetical protein F5Y11DRAFT_328861 [Daldinia sp. FL1419]|nr:hypothetical protein F5Y11DRAFT_328861 [Daldinia sp. FL1419]
MSSNLDLSLPRTAPNSDRHRATSGEDYTQAVYSLTPLDKSELDNLVSRLNSAENIEPGTCKLAPIYDFANQPLRAVYDYHLQLRDQDHAIHPLYFIVAIDADYIEDGVLVVHLDTDQDEEDNRVDKARCSVDWAASWGMNIDIGNTSWEDLKQDESEEWGERAMPWTPASREPTIPEAGQPQLQYAFYSTVKKSIDLPELLEPKYFNTPAAYRRTTLGGNYSTDGGLPEIVRTFPWLCKSYPETHKQMVILADKPDFDAEDGVQLLRFDWDGDVDAYDDDAIADLRLRYEPVKRVAAGKAVEELDRYCREKGLPLAFPEME